MSAAISPRRAVTGESARRGPAVGGPITAVGRAAARSVVCVELGALRRCGRATVDKADGEAVGVGKEPDVTDCLVDDVERVAVGFVRVGVAGEQADERLLDEAADEETVGDVALAAPRWPTSSSPTGDLPLDGGSGRCRCRWRRRSGIGCCRAYTCEAGPFTLAGWLEPAGDVGGDTFDFALERATRCTCR